MSTTGYVYVADRANAYASALVRDLLEDRGMTAADLAELTGIGVRALENRLADHAEWWLGEVITVCDALDLDIREFFADYHRAG